MEKQVIYACRLAVPLGPLDPFGSGYTPVIQRQLYVASGIINGGLVNDPEMSVEPYQFVQHDTPVLRGKDIGFFHRSIISVTDTVVQTVKDAARRCVKVVILTNSPETNDLPILTIVGREYYDDILAVNNEPFVQSCDGGGVQIWEWQGHQTHATEQSEGTIHAKYAVFDRRISIVGSYNLDPRSRTLNRETAMVFENRDLSRQLTGMFYENDLDFSKQITLEDTKEFSGSKDAIYQLQKKFGILIEDLL